MVRRIGVEQAPGFVVIFERRELCAALRREIGRRPTEAAFIGICVGLAEGDHDVVVSREDPSADRLAPVDGIFFAKLLQHRVGIDDELGGDQGVVESLRGGREIHGN